MRLLFLTPFAPEPGAAHGGGAYLGSVLAALASRAEVGVLGFAAPGRAAPGKSPWQWQDTVALPARTAGLRGLPGRLGTLWRWRRLPLVAAKHWHPAMRDRLAAALSEWRPDVVMVELAQMAQYLPFLRGVPTVLTDHEAGCPANTRTGLGPLGDARDRRSWRDYVRRFYTFATALQALTAEDAAALAALLDREVLVRPPACAAAPQPLAPGAAPARVLFVGDYSHDPNPDAARRIATAIVPRLRAALPAVEAWFAGAHAERIADLAALPGVRVLGFVPDLANVLARVRLLLAPVWSGAGFRMKSLVALAHGLPVVTNALGARGCAAPATARALAESPDDLAAAALRWLRDPAAAAAAGRAAHAWAREHLDPAAVAAQQLALAARLAAR
jgi:glycosyltransferase involved in cell wall biosynthesis